MRCASKTFMGLRLFPLTFASSAFVPTTNMPAGLRAFANNQPITKIINAVRDWTFGVPVGDNAWVAVLWSPASCWSSCRCRCGCTAAPPRSSAQW